jgi:hypothetical protein
MTQAEIRKLDEELASLLKEIRNRCGRDHSAIDSASDDLLAGFIQSLGFEQAIDVYNSLRKHR